MDYNPPKMWNGRELGPIQSYLVTNFVRLSHVATLLFRFRRQTYKVDNVCNDDKKIMLYHRHGYK